MSGARPLRVAVDANAPAWGWSGIPKYVDRIVRELLRQGGVEVTLLRNREAGFAAVDGAREVAARRRGGVVWRNSFVLPFLARERPDVYWAPETYAPVWLPVPYVVSVHDLATRLFPSTKPWRQRVAYRFTLPRTARRADRVLAVSETTAADVRRLWNVPSGRIRVVPNGVDEAFAPGDRARAAEEVRRRHGIEGPYVLAVGTLEPRKGLDVLIAAAARAPWRLVLVGSVGYGGDRIAAAAAGARGIVLTGVDDAELVDLYRAADVRGLVLTGVDDAELVDLYRAAEALAAPSLYEGFGVTPLEAMASGTPAVVAGGSGGLEEVSGPAAVVVGERTPDAWLAAIEDARARRDDLAAAGLRHAAGFRWPAVAAAVREALAEAAAER